MDGSKINEAPKPELPHQVFIPKLFKINYSKPTLVSAVDPFITDDAAQEYSSILSENKVPRYLQHYSKFLDSVLDISPSIFEDISKIHIEREAQFLEEEKKEEECLLQQHKVELKLQKSLDQKVTRVLQKQQHYVKRSCPVKIPFKSTLTHEKHEFYLRCFIKYQKRPPMSRLEEKEYEMYMSMQNLVFNEQSCMMNFSYKVAQLTLKQYNTVPPVIENYIAKYVAHKSKRALSYAPHFKNCLQIPLKPQEAQESVSAADHFQLVHLGHLLSTGWIPLLNSLNEKIENKFPMNNSVLSKKMQEFENEFTCKIPLHKCPVSEDPNAEHLARQHRASIVISSSAFKTIVDNQEPTFEKEWNIPVRIKSFKRKDEDGNEVESRIIFIDKPLPKKTWLPLQKKSTFFKFSTKAFLTRFIKNPNFRANCAELSTDGVPFFCPLSHTKKKKKKKSREQPRMDFASDLHLTDDESDLESLNSASTVPCPEASPRTEVPSSTGTESPPPISTPSSLPSSVQSSPSTSHCKVDLPEVGGLLDSLLDKQESFLKPRFSVDPSQELPGPPLLPQPLPSVGNQQGEKLLCQIWPYTLPTDWSNKKMKTMKFGKGNNIHYQLFSFERVAQSPVKGDRVEPFRILVRHKIHGLIPANEKENAKPFVLFPKLENQVYFGCEVNSISEIVQQWASLILRPNVSLLQLRICIESGALVMEEEKSLEMVLKEGKQNHLNFNPQIAYSTLNVLFNTLKKMSSGDYMLQHSAKTEAFIHLLKSCESDVSLYQSRLDLHKMYSDGTLASRSYKTPPWLAIDTHVITPFHKFHKKVPGTFPMQNKIKLDKTEKNKRRQRANKKLVIEGYK